MKRNPDHWVLPRIRASVHNVFAGLAVAGIAVFTFIPNDVDATPAADHFRKDIQPLLAKYCYDCHADGANKGNVAFDELKSDEAIVAKPELWLAALKNLRSGVMPPEKKPHPTAEEIKRIEDWIKFDAFGIDAKNPDPGRVTVRRLNRTEYRNTIKDLMGVDFNTDAEFPPDDAGFGFDNIGDVLTLSPMLLEKYLAAAKTIISQAVPSVPRVPAENAISGKGFQKTGGSTPTETSRSFSGRSSSFSSLSMSYYEASWATNTYKIEHPGKYQVVLDFTASERYVEDMFDYNRCKFIFKVDGKEMLNRDFVREGGKPFHFEYDQDWESGQHEFSFEVKPLTPEEKQIRSLAMRINSVTVRGPMDSKYWVKPKEHARYFPKGDAPEDAAGRQAYAKELLGGFAQKAFRRPIDKETVERLAALAESIYQKPGQSFEAGISQAMVAVLASPRFLFREEDIDTKRPGKGHPLIDEHALASRLSYFLWSSMPDAELTRLANEGKLRNSLDAQVKRMLADAKSESLMQNFVGQWLQTRDVESVSIDARAVLGREREQSNDPELEKARNRFRELRNKPEAERTAEEKAEYEKARATFFRSFNRGNRIEFDGELRRAMRRETEMYFANIVREDLSVLELIDSNYTFLNERLARHYGLTNLNVTGTEMRKVTLPAGSPRGGILTHGTILAVTSNPNRTSPVKRGLFVLDNILGSPPAPPPPDIPPLEDAEKNLGENPSLRKVLAAHREQPLCASCHNRMDSPGLAFENFNAMGMYREKERNQPIDITGKLITGESFTTINEVKHILATKHQDEIYRTLTEKLLTYALGRGLENYDVFTVDQIVERLRKENGKFSAALMGVVESAPFQKRRDVSQMTSAPASTQESKSARGTSSDKP